ncbi:MDS1 and EVI1 complex locus protein EVI1-A [Aplysia californica]|uniref:MDS1 and EVI1 complex locus protein EVI1-A n=1 Tax=Aplysia californica TaxID=6500 RepID=A0ABM0ZY71_APLCA|nr:MDS1 and EVI1 complex locus protein EVI1-A [Aplysia californica]
MRKEAVLKEVVDKLWENLQRLTEERKENQVGWTEGNGEPVRETKQQREKNLKEIQKNADMAVYSLKCDQNAEKQDASKKNQTTNPAKRRRKGENSSRVTTPNVAPLGGPGVPPPVKRPKQGPPTHQSSADPIDREIQPPPSSEVPPTTKLAVSTLSPPSSEVPPTPKLTKATSFPPEVLKAEPGREIKLKDNCWFLCFENFQMVSKSEQEQLIKPNILTTAENKFACKFCADSDVDGGTTNRTFFNRDKDIKRHIATHLEDQFYVCCFCDSQNNCVTDLRRHATGHTDYRLFHCQSCDQSFIQQVSYDTHMKNHHG